MSDDAANPEHSGAIAIVGMAGRFPGADDLQALWKLILEGRDAISRFTPEECDPSDPDPAGVRHADNYVRARGMLERALDFDAPFFDFTPAEAAETDPQHRVWLEVAWEALESAGYAHDRHSQVVGVFAGAFTNTYLLHNLLADRMAVEEYVRMRRVRSFATMLHNDATFLPTRTAYKLDLRGPAINVQTACSTSLVAVAQAMQSLRAFESDVCIAGGVCIAFPQKTGYFHQEGAIFSRDGTCRPYDKDACGTVFGNGAGAVVLRRLEDALRDGDAIRAVILGAAINNDGHTKVGFAAPSVQGQAEVIVAAQTIAGVSADSIGYVEGHGTATPIGDPIEVEALTRAFRASTDKRQFCALGSLKGNIGHLDAAAGVAGLMRAVLALEHATLPATAHFAAPNPELRLAQTPFFVCKTAQPWPSSLQPRRAAVSSFGIGGTNAHAVLEQAPEPAAVGGRRDDAPCTWVLSAKSEDALNAYGEKLASWAEAALLDPAHAPACTDVAFTLFSRRQHFRVRRALRVASLPDAVLALRDPERWVRGTALATRPKLVFVFPGQGSLRAGVLSRLIEEDASFAALLAAPSRAAHALCGFDVLGWLRDPNADVRAVRDDNAKYQLVIFCIGVALARWLMQHGVSPDAMLGHSLGEWIAAHLAGVLELESAVRAVFHRGRLMQSTGRGAAVIVRLSEQDVAKYVTGEISLACVNAPQLVLLSGSVEEIEACVERLRADGVGHRMAPIDVAVHSPRMDAVIAPFAAELAPLAFSPAKIPLLSSVHGRMLTAEECCDRGYWARQLRQQVAFDRAAQALFSGGACVALEVGLGSALTGLLAARRRSRDEQRALACWGASGDDAAPGAASLHECLGALWANGADVSLLGQHERPERIVVLPTYAFQRSEHVVEAPPPTSGRAAPRVSSTPSPRVSSPSQPPPRGSSESTEAELRDKITLVISGLSRMPVADLAPTSTFAELGLDSLFLAQLADALRAQLGRPVRFSQLIAHATIEKLARALHEERAASVEAERASQPPEPVRATGPQPFRGLVELKAGDMFCPMLLIHGDGADRMLPALLPAAQTLYGYVHQGADGERIDLRTVEALAQRCHEEWLAVCGKQPCILVGHSYGGLIAYHVAWLRRQAGLPVKLVCMLDTHHPEMLVAQRELHPRYVWRRLLDAKFEADCERDVRHAERFLADGGRIPAAERTAYTLAMYNLAAAKYVPPPLDANLLLYRAHESWARGNSSAAWRKLVSKQFETIETPGDHLSIVRTEAGFAPIAQALIERVLR